MIDWTDIHPDYQWAAMDSGGEWYAYDLKPKSLTRNWNNDFPGTCVFLYNDPSKTVKWRESLTQRNDMNLDDVLKL